MVKLVRNNMKQNMNLQLLTNLKKYMIIKLYNIQFMEIKYYMNNKNMKNKLLVKIIWHH